MLPAIAFVLSSGAARAEGDQALSAELGWATFSTPGKKVGTMEPPAVTPDIGGSLGVVYERSLSSDFSLRGELAGAMFSGGNSAKQSSLSYATVGDVGGVFRFDVLKYVPYAFGGVGAIVSSGGPIDQGGQFVVTIGGGCDVLASRSRSYGVEARLASFGGNITIFTLSLRGTIRWGYF